MFVQLCEYTKTIEKYTLNWLIIWYVCMVNFNEAVIKSLTTKSKTEYYNIQEMQRKNKKRNKKNKKQRERTVNT